MSAKRALFLSTLFALLAACTQKPQAPTAVAAADLPCSTDAECTPKGLVCDALRRTCVCTSDAMCVGSDGGPYCNAFTGRCVREIGGCKSDAECGDARFCDIAVRTCRDRKAWCAPCNQDAECGGENDFCIRHPDFSTSPTFCASACNADGSCPTNQRCADTEKGRQCIPQIGRCNQVSACTPDSGQACAADADCTQGSGQVCDAVQGRCIAAEKSCAAGQSCDPVTRQCVASCRLDAECRERFNGDSMYVCVNNTCVYAESCLQDGDCPAAKYCAKADGAASGDAGTCRLSCTGDSECPLGQRCLVNGENRKRCTDSCVSNADCPLNAICNGTRCETVASDGSRRCQTHRVCNAKEWCVNNSCTAVPSMCAACSNVGAACGTTGLICANIYPVGQQRFSRCLPTCSIDDDCPNGFYCPPGLPTCYPIESDAPNYTSCR
jgi:hypothetical protein